MVTTAAAFRPTTVGVSPGTTTMLLTGPTASAPEPIVGCENPARAARQRYLMFPPGKYVAMGGQVIQKAATTIKQVVDPYETLESLKGLGRAALRGSGLGAILAPYGNQTPNPSNQLVAATRSRDYCTRRPSMGPNYRQDQTLAYEPGARNHGINGLGAVPTDLQLATQFQYTPVISQWIPFTNKTWSPAPWNPPTGATGGDPGFWSAPTAGPMQTIATGQPLNQYLGGLGDTTATPVTDPVTASVLEQRAQNDRMYLLGIISAAAVASTALINVFRFHQDKKSGRRGTHVAAEPPAMISGTRRRRRARR